jgi:hypothetical protein
LRLHGVAPERRSYHTSFVYNNRLFIFGGLDIQEGSLGSLWELDLSALKDLDLDEDVRYQSCSWKAMKTTGNPAVIPDRVAYHTSVVYRDSMYVFGGNNYKQPQFVGTE